MSKKNEFFITADGIEFSVLKNDYDVRNYDKKFFDFYEKLLSTLRGFSGIVNYASKFNNICIPQVHKFL